MDYIVVGNHVVSLPFLYAKQDFTSVTVLQAKASGANASALPPLRKERVLVYYESVSDTIEVPVDCTLQELVEALNKRPTNGKTE